MRDCEESTTYYKGQVILPGEMQLRVGQSGTYSAAVDVQTKPGPPGKQIDSPDPRVETIKVQCVLSARLVPVGEEIEVEPATDADDAGWRKLRFTPNGVVEWSWTVKPLVPVDQELRLELMPAVEIDGDTEAFSGSANYTTIVIVEATILEKASHWFSTQWKLLAGIAAVLGTAFLAVLAFSSQVREAFGKLFKPKVAATAAAPAPPPPTEEPKKKKGKKKH